MENFNFCSINLLLVWLIAIAFLTLRSRILTQVSSKISYQGTTHILRRGQISKVNFFALCSGTGIYSLCICQPNEELVIESLKNILFVYKTT
jgi:hypothetical protein